MPFWFWLGRVRKSIKAAGVESYPNCDHFWFDPHGLGNKDGQLAPLLALIGFKIQPFFSRNTAFTLFYPSITPSIMNIPI
jgi:hypothetical protein